MFLLDTNVVSHARLAKQNPSIKDWFARQEAIAIPFPVFIEIQQGIFNTKRDKPEKAIELTIWLQSILDSDFYMPPMTPAVAIKIAEMYSCRPLKHLWHVGEQREKRPGQDLAIAAISIIYSLPIATLDSQDFAQINSNFALPGVYNPASGLWAVSPPRSDDGPADETCNIDCPRTCVSLLDWPSA